MQDAGYKMQDARYKLQDARFNGDCYRDKIQIKDIDFLVKVKN